MATDDLESASATPTASVTIELDRETGEIRIERRTALGTVTERVER